MLENRWVDVPGMSGSECVSPCVRLRGWQPVSGHASSSTLGNKNLSESGVGMEERKQEAFPHCGHIFRPATFFFSFFVNPDPCQILCQLQMLYMLQ